jgi:conjugal transfer pilus assembly protein TraW
LGTNLLHAKDLGVYGETFPIVEDNLLKVIQQKLQTLEHKGKIVVHQQELARKAAHRIQNPPAVEGLKTTTTPRAWLYDPRLKVQDDIKDHQGKIIVAKGTVVNPLDTVSWGAPLLFLNGDDPAQIAWAKGQDPTSKWVLIKGQPLELEEQLGRPIYFDQGSMLVRKFGIQQVPCRITQQDKSLKVEEIKLTGTPHE